MNSSKSQHNHGNTKDQLVPPGGAAGPPRQGGRKPLLAAMVVFAILLCSAVGVLFFLPADKTQVAVPPVPIEKQAAQVQQRTVIETEQSQQAETTLEVESAAADQAREQVWALKIEAEAEHITRWGGQEYQKITERLEQADRLLNDRAFQAAAESYRSISPDLQALLDSKEQRYQQALAAGQGALAEELPDAAKDHFNNALAVEPSSRQAKSGLEQAEILAATRATYHNALSLENQGRFEEALDQLNTIIGPGSSYEPALEAQKRIQAQLNEFVFEQEMDNLYLALKVEDFASAQSSLQTLKKLGSHRQEVEQAAALLAQKQTRAAIDQLKEKAERLRAQEQWQQAHEAYGAILGLDPNLLFATAGQEEAGKRAELDRSMRDAIDRPHRLQDTEQQSAAASLVTYARQIEPQGPKLESQIEALESLLRAVQTPVAVILESDNQTDITIYHVGRIGLFLSKEIALKPGTYTVVGSRDGYRDVRKEITVGADGSSYRYDIRCEEAI